MANELEMTALSEAEKDCEMQFAGTSPQIIVEGTKENPYYNIMYRDAADGFVCVGFGSYDLENVFVWLKEYFGEDQAEVVDPDSYRPTGRWEEEDERSAYYGRLVSCSECGGLLETHKKQYFKYCYNCGAKMEG